MRRPPGAQRIAEIGGDPHLAREEEPDLGRAGERVRARRADGEGGAWSLDRLDGDGRRGGVAVEVGAPRLAAVAPGPAQRLPRPVPIDVGDGRDREAHLVAAGLARERDVGHVVERQPAPVDAHRAAVRRRPARDHVRRAVPVEIGSTTHHAEELLRRTARDQEIGRRVDVALPRKRVARLESRAGPL
jgi:hypothetical protein